MGGPPDSGLKNQVGIIDATEEKFEKEYIYLFGVFNEELEIRNSFTSINDL